MPRGWTPEQFCLWLQGFVELKEMEHDKSLTLSQWDAIKQHLGFVFEHIGAPAHGPVSGDRGNGKDDRAKRTFAPLDIPRRDLDKILVC